MEANNKEREILRAQELTMYKTMDKLIRDMLISSDSDKPNISDQPTELALYDTVEILSKINPNWANDELCQMILSWQASFFLNTHTDKVIAEKCPHLRELCVEYRELKTMHGKPLSPLFGLQALDYIIPKYEHSYFDGPFGTSPVRNAFWKYK